VSGPKPPAFQFYVRDFTASLRVAGMELDEVGAYILLLSHSWLEVGLPDDERLIARMLRLKHTDKRFQRIWRVVRSAFELREGRWYNARQERERAIQAENRVQRKRAADTRWGNLQKHSKRNAHASDVQSSAVASASANTPLVPPANAGSGGLGGTASPKVISEVLEELKPKLGLVS
jgi:uncharacterized protein YdaU (DUF1376 family)